MSCQVQEAIGKLEKYSDRASIKQVLAHLEQIKVLKDKFTKQEQDISAELVERLQTNKATTNTTNDIINNIINCEG